MGKMQDRAKAYIDKQKLLGLDTIELIFDGDDGVILSRVKDNGSKSFVIPSFITSYKVKDKTTNPFEGTTYEEIIVESSVGDLGGLFRGIRSIRLKVIINSNIKIRNLKEVFSDSEELKELVVDVKGCIDTSDVQSVYCMYRNCRKLREIDISWLSGASNIKDMNGIFYGCGSLRKIIGLNRIDLRSVEDMSYMFTFCTYLEDIGVDKIVVSGVKEVAYMFSRCEHIKNVKIQGNLSNILNMEYMFSGCSLLMDVYIEGDLSNVINLYSMFYMCKGLQEVELRSISSTRINSMEQMFSGCERLEVVKLGNIDFGSMMRRLSNYRDIYYSKVKIVGIFEGCNRLNSIELMDSDGYDLLNKWIPDQCKIIYVRD